MVNNFCAFVTTNQVMDYASNIYKQTIEDVAILICTDLNLANISLTLSLNYMEGRDITSAYDEFCDVENYYQNVLDRIDENSEYKDKFLSMDISDARKILDNCKQYFKNYADAYSKRDTVSLDEYTDQITYNLYEMITMVEEIENNAKKYSDEI